MTEHTEQADPSTDDDGESSADRAFVYRVMSAGFILFMLWLAFTLLKGLAS